ncbi:MAG TPA: formyltransferase family protein [Patescibacteria group bacterium]|jgi:methionyl-tRNA formyltransferase|nr:formyltransferase family protein [Patescibacteria group bacterium]
MKIVFFGNTKHSLIGAKIIHQAFGLSLIVTIPGSPLEKFAGEEKISCLLVTKLTDKEIAKIEEIQPDFLVVEDYGLILPEKLLNVPKYASLNIHHSLLPKYRGPAPAPAAILAGDKISGVSIIKMSAKVDAGAIFAQKEYVLKPDETTDSLLNELNLLGGNLAVSVINDILQGKAKAVPQDESKTSLTKYMQKSDGYIDLSQLEIKNFELKIGRMVRAYFPWPGVWTQLRLSSAGQGKIIKFLPNKMIQVEGKKEMSYKDFINGYPNADPTLIQFLKK